MFYDSIKVKIPAKKRIRHSSNKEYVYEILCRKSKECAKEKSVCVGVNIDNIYMNPNEIYFNLHPESVERPDGKELVFNTQLSIGSQLVLRKIAADEGIKDYLDDIFQGKSEIIQSFIEYCLLERDSSSQIFKYYLYDNYSLLNYIPSESLMSDLFNRFIDHESVNNFLSKWLEFRLSRYDSQTVVDIDFDSTNKNISSGNLSLAEYGHPKVNEGLPQVNVAYFVDRSSGVPLYFDIFYGSIIDMEHCKNAIKKIKTLSNNVKGSFVLDRGYFSSSNLEYFSSNNYSFMCMGKENNKFHELIKEYPTNILNVSRNRIYGTIYGIKTEGFIQNNAKEQYYLYLYCDEGLSPKIISEKQNEIEYYAENLIGKKDKDNWVKNTYGAMIDYKIENNIVTEARPKYEYIDEIRSKTGYFWIVSNENLTPEEILRSYRHRDIIEKDFRNMKSGMDMNKTYSGSDTSFESKMLLSFIGSIYRSYINLKCKPYLFQYRNETSQTILRELGKICIDKVMDRYILKCPVTARQSQILSHFGIDKNIILREIEKINFSKQNTIK